MTSPMTAASPATTHPRSATNSTTAVVADLIEYLETGSARPGLFAAEVFLDLTLPLWRVQGGTDAQALAIRSAGHPFPGKVHVERVEQTGHGFTLEFEERWQQDGQDWYCREMLRADVVDDSIVDMSVYCTGDWDEAKQREHAAAVRLIRP